jgi:hypothetical protein
VGKEGFGSRRSWPISLYEFSCKGPGKAWKERKKERNDNTKKREK